MSATQLAGSISTTSAWRDYAELVKARIVMMVLFTTAAGFALASSRPFDGLLLINTLIGTALVAAGTNGFNQYLERHLDSQMHRTRRRPLPDGRMADRAAFWFCLTVSILGTVWLAVTVNWVASLLGFFTLATYLFIYTPMKRTSSLCTLFGAVPGAVPPIIGWVGAGGALDLSALLLFLILFLWQLPHFLAISWIYREDYARAGFRMLSVEDVEGRAVGRQAMFYSLALLTVSVLPVFYSAAGSVYLIAAAASGIALLALAALFARARSISSARRLFLGSNVYLLVIMTFLIASHFSR